MVDGARLYRVTCFYRIDAHVPRYTTESVIEPAFTAADAETQVRIRFSGALEMKIVGVAPADESSVPSIERG